MSRARDIADSASTINALDGVTATGTELNILDGVTATTSELNILDGVTATATELNTLDALTRGSIIYGNSSGATAELTKGTADQVLTSDGTDIAWADAGGGVWTHINTTTVSSGTSITFNSFSETYDHWVIIFSDVKNTQNDATRLELQMEVGGSVVTGSNTYHGRVSTGNGSSQTSTESIYLQYSTPLQAIGTFRASGIIYVLNTQGSLQETQVHGQGGYGNDSSSGEHVSFYGHRRSTAGALTGVKLSLISGIYKTLSGKFSIYGIKTS